MEDICNHVREQQKSPPPPEWGADYVAGVDVHGNDVTPADLNVDNNNALFDPVSIPIEIDLAERFGLALPSEMDLKPEVFRINIFSNGSVSYNDQDITPKINDLCDDFYKENAQENELGHGQNEADALPSDDTIMGQYPDYNE